MMLTIADGESKIGKDETIRFADSDAAWACIHVGEWENRIIDFGKSQQDADDLASRIVAPLSTPAPVAAPPADLVAKREEVDCPECHETCGWCSWYRKNAREAGCGSGSRNKCAWGQKAHGVPCKTCDGSGRVMATTTYEPIRGAR